MQNAFRDEMREVMMTISGKVRDFKTHEQGNRSTMETIEILSDTMCKGMSEYAIEGCVTWLRGTLIFPSVGSGRGDGRRRYGWRLELGAWGLAA
jgi:hypothetical protein